MKFLANSIARALALAILMFGRECIAAPAAVDPTNSQVLFKQLTTLDPGNPTNLAPLAALAQRAAAREKQETKAEKNAKLDDSNLADLSAPELQKRFTVNSVKHNTRAYAAIEQLANEALLASNSPVRDSREADIREIQASLRNASRPLVPDKLGVFTSWFLLFDNVSGSIGRGETVAANLRLPTNAANDPLPSTFWSRPTSISNQDLYAGFGRTNFPQLENVLCTHSAPKTSSGTHAGFEVEINGERYKIKFGDLKSEPFTARIFDALGFHVDPTDYAAQIKVRYDRRLLREFHLRKPLDMRITPLGIHVATIHLQAHFDPFSFITHAVFADGREVSGPQLKQILFFKPTLAHPEEFPENFRTNIESTLAYLVMAPANVQPRDGPTQSIGSWEFGGLGHENLRELRGAGLLAAWLSWFDSRGDNTKLRVVRDTDDVELQHFFSDLGGGMGAGTGFFSPHGENPNEFTWTFTAPEIMRGPGCMTTPFRITHFKPTIPTPAFAAMTRDDAQWMARLIAQLTENQLRAALIASGYDNAEAQLYLEKLINRRDQMIRDLNLDREIPPLRAAPIDRDFSYRPATGGPFTAVVNGTKISARESSAVIIRGKIIQR